MLARFCKDTRGAIAGMTAILMSVLLGIAGMGVEFGYWYTVKRSMQGAADAGALSAASASAAGNTGFAAEADAVVAQNGWAGEYATNDSCSPVTATKVCVNSPPKYGNFTSVATAIEVVIARPQSSIFGGFIGYSSDTTIRVHAVVSPGKTGNGCILALDTGNSIRMNGNGNLTLAGCDADGHGNIQFNGINSRLTVRSFDIAGTVSAPSQLTNTGPAGTSSDPNPPADPYASPARSIGDKAGAVSRTATGTTLLPGAYVGGINLTSSVTLASGIYYIEGGCFCVSGSPGTTVTSAAGGVTIVLTSNAAGNFASVSITGNAALNLTALSTGPTRGLVFYGDPANTTNVNENFAGNGTNSLTGAIYFPHQTVTLAGNGTFSSPKGCFEIVAFDIVNTGNGTLSDGCIGTGVAPIGGSATQLVE